MASLLSIRPVSPVGSTCIEECRDLGAAPTALPIEIFVLVDVSVVQPRATVVGHHHPHGAGRFVGFGSHMHRVSAPYIHRYSFLRGVDNAPVSQPWSRTLRAISPTGGPVLHRTDGGHRSAGRRDRDLSAPWSTNLVNPLVDRARESVLAAGCSWTPERCSDAWAERCAGLGLELMCAPRPGRLESPSQMGHGPTTGKSTLSLTPPPQRSIHVSC